ncbi:MAG: NADAR family protein [Opitutaceae bacterium]|nr:NADAR family protein [Opitutaceae bacterium]
MPNYKKSEVAWFFSKEDPRWELSNMAGQMPVYWPLERSADNRWNSTEQLYQASKYKSDVICRPKENPEADPNVRRRIRAMTNARGAKMTQKCAVKAGLVRPDWDSSEEVRLKAMEWVLELKVYWNRWTFGEVLLRTGDKVIVEVSNKDMLWGCRDDGAGNLEGENKLGEILMGVRARVPKIMQREFSHPEGFLLP